jgi:hypothetical protein
MKKQTSSAEPESLPSRIYRTLDGVPRNGTMKGGKIKKSPIEFVWFCSNLFTTTTNAKKPLTLIGYLAAAFGIQSTFNSF